MLYRSKEIELWILGLLVTGMESPCVFACLRSRARNPASPGDSSSLQDRSMMNVKQEDEKTAVSDNEWRDDGGVQGRRGGQAEARVARRARLRESERYTIPARHGWSGGCAPGASLSASNECRQAARSHQVPVWEEAHGGAL